MTRVLVIGLDMADAGLVETWAAAGTLPTLAALMKEGAWGRLATTAEVLHTSAWPTIFTGTLPGRHGVYYPYQPCPGAQTARPIAPGQYGRPPFWAVLDRAGRRCAVVDAPETFPVAGFGGVQVFEWSTWAWYWRPMTVPAGLHGELRRRFGRPPLRLEARRLGLALPDPGALHRQLLDSVRVKARAARWLMARRPWDAFVVVFAEPHPGGHYLWPRDAGAGADALRSVYAALDAAVGELLEAAGDGATVLVVSGDGVGPNHAGWHLLPEVLRRAGFLAAPAGGAEAPGRDRRGVLGRLRDAVPPGARAAVSARLPWRLRDRLVSRLATAGVDWSASTAFCLPTDLEGCIRINLKGREPQGVVEPGRHYEDVCDELTATLAELVNPATGRPAVQTVWRTDRCFPGDRRHHLPDLVVTWRRDAEIAALSSPRLGLIEAAPVDPRPGTHAPHGFLLARGPRVRPGPLPDGHHIVDLAPTVLACLGVAPETALDGRPLETVAA